MVDLQSALIEIILATNTLIKNYCNLFLLLIKINHNAYSTDFSGTFKPLIYLTNTGYAHSGVDYLNSKSLNF